METFILMVIEDSYNLGFTTLGFITIQKAIMVHENESVGSKWIRDVVETEKIVPLWIQRGPLECVDVFRPKPDVFPSNLDKRNDISVLRTVRGLKVGVADGRRGRV
jgi:hypothetical protein